jgi:hypothetical protein
MQLGGPKELQLRTLLRNNYRNEKLFNRKIKFKTDFQYQSIQLDKIKRKTGQIIWFLVYIQ